MSFADCLQGAWVALYVRPHHERTVTDHLEAHGYEAFLPTYSPRGPAAKTTAASPLFPGYVFCRYVRQPAFRMVQVPGVVRILSSGGGLAVVSEEEIDTIRRIASRDVDVEPWRFLQVGERVRIICGPLCGLEGTLVACGNRLRMVVSVTLLRRAVAVTVDSEQLMPLSSVA